MRWIRDLNRSALRIMRAVRYHAVTHARVVVDVNDRTGATGREGDRRRDWHLRAEQEEPDEKLRRTWEGEREGWDRRRRRRGCSPHNELLRERIAAATAAKRLAIRGTAL